MAAAAKPADTGNDTDFRQQTRGLTWQTRTPNRNTTTTSSTRARGRSSARSARFVMAIGGVACMQYIKGGDFPIFGVNIANPWLFFIGLLIVLYTMFAWWSDTIKEAHEGHHTRVVSLHLRYGMIMFIASEVMFFVAWFWAFFDASLFPNEAAQYAREAFTGGVWPPKGVEVLDPFHLPLYNTIILLLSGTTVTWAHHALLHDDRKGLISGPRADRRPRRAVLDGAGLRVHARAVRLQGFDLRRDLLHGDRLPRLPRADRHDLPAGLPDPGDGRATSRRSSISASRRPPGTGISSTSSGCSCSPASMSGRRPARRSRTDGSSPQSRTVAPRLAHQRGRSFFGSRLRRSAWLHAA